MVFLNVFSSLKSLLVCRVSNRTWLLKIHNVDIYIYIVCNVIRPLQDLGVHVCVLVVLPHTFTAFPLCAHLALGVTDLLSKENLQVTKDNRDAERKRETQCSFWRIQIELLENFCINSYSKFLLESILLHSNVAEIFDTRLILRILIYCFLTILNNRAANYSNVGQ